MFHNSGPFGPNEAPVNMGTAGNMSAINAPINIPHNLSNLNNIGQQTAHTSSTHYNLSNYTNFSHSAVNLSPQIPSFPRYHSVEFQPSYLTDNNWENGVLPVDSNAHANQCRNLSIYPNNYDKRLTKPNVHSEPYESQKYLNIPQTSPTRTFQKVANDNESYDLFSATHEKFNHYGNHNNVSINIATQSTLLDSTRRKSLENTVRFIENILENTTKNRESQMNKEMKSSNEVSTYNDVMTEKNEGLDVKAQEMTHTVMENCVDCVLEDQNKNLGTVTLVLEEKATTDTQSDTEDIKHNFTKTGQIIIELQEAEPIIDVKVEPLTDFNDLTNPFQHDSHGLQQEDAKGRVINCDDSVNEAMAAIKNDSNPDCFYECLHCPLVFKHPKRFLIHVKWHTFGLTNERRMEIAKERDRLRNLKKEAKHMAKKIVPKKKDSIYKCKDCDQVFRAKGTLKNHRFREHPSRIRECKICGVLLPGSWAEQRKHANSHNTASLQCNQCGKRYKHKHSLAKHKETHLEKTVSCEQCPKKFGSVNQLRIHSKTHERALRGATYRCTYCAKAYYQAYNLAVHERTHRNEKPFSCEICGSRFLTNSSLKRHLKVSHSSSKPYPCTTCHRSFATAASLAQHATKHDPHGAAHACPHCQCRYQKQKDLQKHMSKTHPKERTVKRKTSSKSVE